MAAARGPAEIWRFGVTILIVGTLVITLEAATTYQRKSADSTESPESPTAGEGGDIPTECMRGPPPGFDGQGPPPPPPGFNGQGPPPPPPGGFRGPPPGNGTRCPPPPPPTGRPPQQNRMSRHKRMAYAHHKLGYGPGSHENGVPGNADMDGHTQDDGGSPPQSTPMPA